MDLTVDGDSNYTSTGTSDTFTPPSNGAAGSDVVAEHIRGVCQAVTEMQSLLGNALTLKGTVADLVTRLSRVIHEDGAIAKGTSFPGTPIDGQPFYRTDQNILYIYDAGTTTWTVGVDTGEFLKIDGTRDMTGDLEIEKAVPSVRLRGTEGSGLEYRISENAGVLTTYRNTGTEESPTWTEDNFFVPPGAEFLYGGTVCPTGYYEENGQAVSRTTDARLFAVFGTVHGVGDGSTTFNLPDYRDRLPLPAGASYTKDFTISSVNTGTEELTVPSNLSLFTGQKVLYDNVGGTVITGLADATDYYIIRVSATLVKLATTEQLAMAGTAINLTGAGTGTHFLKQTFAARARGDFGGTEQSLGVHDHGITDPGHSHTSPSTSGGGGAGVRLSDIASINSQTKGTTTELTGVTIENGGDVQNGANMPPFAVTGMWIVKR